MRGPARSGYPGVDGEDLGACAQRAPREPYITPTPSGPHRLYRHRPTIVRSKLWLCTDMTIHPLGNETWTIKPFRQSAIRQTPRRPHSVYWSDVWKARVP